MDRSRNACPAESARRQIMPPQAARRWRSCLQRPNSTRKNKTDPSASKYESREIDWLHGIASSKRLQCSSKPTTLPPPKPTPATAPDPAPPESPSAKPEPPPRQAFPHPSPTLPDTDLQSTLSIITTSSNAGAVLHLAIIAAKGNIRPRTLRHTFQSTARFALAAAALASVLIPVAGCGNTYRPIVSRHQPRRSRRPAAEVRRRRLRLSHARNSRPHDARRLLRRHHPRHPTGRSLIPTTSSSTAPDSPAIPSTATAPSPPSIFRPRSRPRTSSRPRCCPAPTPSVSSR